MSRLAYFGARVLRRAARVLEEVGSTQTTLVQRTMTTYDMVANADEGYYREQYWRWLLPECERRFPDRSAHILDVGCGQGRLALPLAAWFERGSVVGIDVTSAAVEQARRYAKLRGLTNVTFYEADALAFLNALPPASSDMVLMIEAAFFMPSYRRVIAAIARVLKTNGVFLVSFRSQYFNLLYSVRLRDWPSAFLVRDAREGHWGGGVGWFSWHTTVDIRQLLAEAGFVVTQLRGIGITSGIDGDPLSSIAQPSKLSPGELAHLMDIETYLAEQYADCGRYILAIANKSLS